MTVLYHPEFPEDIKRFEAQYREISEPLSLRFRAEIEESIRKIKASPTSAGHFVQTGSIIVKDIRRRNLSKFPLFILYGLHHDRLIFRAVIPSGSDPLTWLPKFKV